MLIKKKARTILVFLLLLIILLSLLPFNVLSETNPWSAYSKYIPTETPAVKRQLRGIWITTVKNLDWPSLEAKNIKNQSARIQKSKDELIAILDKAVEMNINAVFFQVSPEGDAFYKSNVVPWSRYLTGTFGKDPGFDPLTFAVHEAHARNLEFHAWFNPYRVSTDTTNTTISSLKVKKSVYQEHPNWVKTSANRFVVDPGIPDARKWVINRVMEVASNYDIDGIHFDDYFYYENYEGELKDQDTFKKYNNKQFTNIRDWRRNNTYLLVSELSKKIKTRKPWVKFGISPSAIWGNKRDGHSDGSNTHTSFTNFEKAFADTKKWVEKEIIDYIAPQVYFTFASPRAPYGEITSWWSKVCKGKKVHLYIGQALYKVNDDSDQYFNGDQGVLEFSRQIKFNIINPGIMGSILFRIKNINDSNKQQAVLALKNNLWSTKALVPVMPWKGGKAPSIPTQGNIVKTSKGLKLTWDDKYPKTAYYAIYRFNKGEKVDISSNESTKKLINTVRKFSNGKQEYLDTAANNPDDIFYVVTSLDRLHNESKGLVIHFCLYIEQASPLLRYLKDLS